jgi:cytochrome d ubiquinol oxidase subunit II
VEAAWFFLLAFMVSVYVVLDGFDLGVGILHLVVARTDQERRAVLSAIGPIWDGNEVWLLAFGGLLVYSFPRVYAVAFSSFYLALILVLWLLILRGISIEFRSRHPNPLWRAFWDAGFAFGSLTLAVVLGVAFGNVVRGVPLDASGYFLTPYFGDFRPGSASGALDWYTVSVGVFAALVLAGHGALYLVWKTDGPVQDRSRRLAARLWTAVIAAGLPLTIATAHVAPAAFSNFAARPALWPLPVLVLGAVAVVLFSLSTRRELAGFVASAAFIAAMLGTAAGAMYPALLRSTIDPALDLTAANASAGRTGLAIGLAWWVPAILLAIGYFAYLFRAMRGKVDIGGDDHGY